MVTDIVTMAIVIITTIVVVVTIAIGIIIITVADAGNIIIIAVIVIIIGVIIIMTILILILVMDLWGSREGCKNWVHAKSSPTWPCIRDAGGGCHGEMGGYGGCEAFCM